jgi:hypothetical protein
MEVIEMDIVYLEPDGSLLMTCEVCKKILRDEDKDCEKCEIVWCG